MHANVGMRTSRRLSGQPPEGQARRESGSADSHWMEAPWETCSRTRHTHCDYCHACMCDCPSAVCETALLFYWLSLYCWNVWISSCIVYNVFSSCEHSTWVCLLVICSTNNGHMWVVNAFHTEGPRVKVQKPALQNITCSWYRYVGIGQGAWHQPCIFEISNFQSFVSSYAAHAFSQHLAPWSQARKQNAGCGIPSDWCLQAKTVSPMSEKNASS